jgi:hypothetical protein
MALDQLILGGISFDDFSTPTEMPAGGEQAMVVHKLPGGARVIDTLGPDEADIVWSGFFFGDNAYDSAKAVDAMRQGGQVVPLIWAGQFRSVIVRHFIYKIRRLPTWVFYDICCTVTQNPSLGVLGATISSIDTLVQSDLAIAVGLL